MAHAIISKELAALDAVIEGASALAAEALARKADLKQGKLTSELYGRMNNAIRLRLESRLNQGRIVELEAKLIEHQRRLSDENSSDRKSPAGARSEKDDSKQ